MDRNISLIFFGSFGEYSQNFLRILCGKFAVNAVVTSPPKPAGRHLKITPTLVDDYAKSQNIPVFYDYTNLPDCDFIIVAGYGKLIPESILNLPKIMPINFHPSLLPHYSGPTPVEFALLNSETETGITFIKISPRFDQGDIIYQEKVPIQPTDNRLTLYQKLFALGAQKALDLLSQKDFVLAPQPRLENAVKSKKLTRQDGFIEYSEYQKFMTTGHWSSNIERKLRAFAGWPGVWTVDPSGHRLIISK